MSVDASRLRRGEVIAAASAAVMFVVMFIPWYGYKVNTVALGSFEVPFANQDAWNGLSIISIYLLVTILVAIALVLTQASRRSPALPVSLSVIVSVLGGLATLLVLFRIVDPPGISGIPAVVASHLGRTLKVGIWGGLLAALGITAGGYLSLREEGVRVKDGPGEIETVSVAGTGHA